jgi:hypothetical protein
MLLKGSTLMTKDIDIASLSDDELMDEWTKTGDEAQALKVRLKEFSAEHQRRTRKAQLAHLANMSEEDMALLQEVRAEGLESKEAVGTPGNEGDDD